MDRQALKSKTYRIIPTKYPPIRLFEDCSDPDDMDETFLLESLSNDRLQDLVGYIALVTPEDRVVGDGSSPIMAAFTHIEKPSRFTDGSFGVYYAALDERTAVFETMFSSEQVLRLTNEPPMVLDMRGYISCPNPDVGEFVDLRSDDRAHDPDSYVYSRAIAAELRHKNEFGIYYRSVRHEGGECIAALRPVIMQPAVQGSCFQYHWDGNSISRVSSVKDYKI